MNSMANILAQIIENSHTAIKINNNDYIKDGILYCGNCNTKKQSLINVQGMEFKPMCLCKCGIEKRNSLEIEQKNRDIVTAKLERLSLLNQHNLLKGRLKDIYLDSFIKNKNNEKALNIAKDFINKFSNKSKGLLFSGDVGTGKSYISAIIANELVKRGKTAIMLNLNSLISDTDNQNALLKQLALADLIIFDDLGTERQTSYGFERAYDFINARYITEKPTIYTTNKSVDEMIKCENIDQKRMYDRILGSTNIIRLKGDSLRVEQAKKAYIL
ncbi:MAG: ATP-binding protein [Christensenellaceae bacterium]|nr:ATP-binding protein [Christensenellaceae bacterium]